MAKKILESNSINLNVQNRTFEKAKQLEEFGANSYKTVKELISNLKQEKKIIWLMLPPGEVTESTFNFVLSLLKEGDIIIDGGNSNFQDTIRRVKISNKKGIEMIDVGVSGGIIAAKTGYPLMIGSKKEIYEFVLPLFKSFALKQGFGRVGESGSGHYVKMIHNAVEYGMMQSISEGFDLLENGRFKNLDLKKISNIWNHGTIVDSFLMKMVEQALTKDNKLNYLKPYIEDTGEGRWSTIEALNYKVPFVANSYAVNARYISRDSNSYAFRLIAAIRNEFGGHDIKK